MDDNQKQIATVGLLLLMLLTATAVGSLFSNPLAGVIMGALIGFPCGCVIRRLWKS